MVPMNVNLPLLIITFTGYVLAKDCEVFFAKDEEGNCIDMTSCPEFMHCNLWVNPGASCECTSCDDTLVPDNNGTCSYCPNYFYCESYVEGTCECQACKEGKELDADGVCQVIDIIKDKDVDVAKECETFFVKDKEGNCIDMTSCPKFLHCNLWANPGDSCECASCDDTLVPDDNGTCSYCPNYFYCESYVEGTCECQTCKKGKELDTDGVCQMIETTEDKDVDVTKECEVFFAKDKEGNCIDMTSCPKFMLCNLWANPGDSCECASCDDTLLPDNNGACSYCPNYFYCESYVEGTCECQFCKEGKELDTDGVCQVIETTIEDKDVDNTKECEVFFAKDKEGNCIDMTSCSKFMHCNLWANPGDSCECASCDDTLVPDNNGACSYCPNYFYCESYVEGTCECQFCKEGKELDTDGVCQVIETTIEDKDVDNTKECEVFFAKDKKGNCIDMTSCPKFMHCKLWANPGNSCECASCDDTLVPDNNGTCSYCPNYFNCESYVEGTCECQACKEGKELDTDGICQGIDGEDENGAKESAGTKKENNIDSRYILIIVFAVFPVVCVIVVVGFGVKHYFKSENKIALANSEKGNTDYDNEAFTPLLEV